MSNFGNSPLNMSSRTPLKRLGLSRKRKSCGTKTSEIETEKGVESCSTEKFGVEEGCSDKKIQKQINPAIKGDNESGPSKLEENIHALPDNENEDEHPMENEVKSIKTTSKLEKDIEELEDLYSTWVKGCKNALLYLIKLIEDKQGEAVNVEKMMKDLGIWNAMHCHFKNDSDFDFLTCDSESTDH